MGERSAIEWTDASWTPIRARNLATGKVGWHCERVTAGCANCYAEGLNRRLGSGLAFKPGRRSEVEIFLDEWLLMAPLRWRRPRKIFVCSMTDLFAGFVPAEWINLLFAVMAECWQHTFQIVTKRPARMLAYLTDEYVTSRIGEVQRGRFGDNGAHTNVGLDGVWPLSNVWLGVSAERQAEADERVPLLLDTPAAVRFVSAEPLLGPISLRPFLHDSDCLRGADPAGVCTCCDPREVHLDWVIVGGESGPGARPMHPDWARSLRSQCVGAEVPFFFKQWGEWRPAPEPLPSEEAESLELQNRYEALDGTDFQRVGKRAAGRLLDGREWSEFPAGREARR